jgi:hypothetical protein
VVFGVRLVAIGSATTVIVAVIDLLAFALLFAVSVHVVGPAGAVHVVFTPLAVVAAL